MKTTPIYGLPYLEGSDLVSGAPAQFETMASGIESALQEVDNRATPAGATPRLATTLDALSAQSGVTGQLGIVTGSGIDRGAYRYRPDDDDRWGPVTLESAYDRISIVSQYWTINTMQATLIDHRLLYLAVNATRKGVDFTGGSVWSSSPLLTFKNMSIPNEFHSQAISTATSPQSILVQAISNQINLRKPSSSDRLAVGGWLQFSVLIPVTVE